MDLAPQLRLPRVPPRASPGAFTIVEILVVMSIILVLAGLVLATSSYVHNKGARSRAEAEIAAISAALENYKADNGAYPSDSSTDSLDARVAPNPSSYQTASLWLYKKLSGDTDANRQPDPNTVSYMAFKDNQLSPATANVDFVKDPFGNSYGYSTAYQFDVSSNQPPTRGYNPTFDLWSTAGASTDAGKVGWIKNW